MQPQRSHPLQRVSRPVKEWILHLVDSVTKRIHGVIRASARRLTIGGYFFSGLLGGQCVMLCIFEDKLAQMELSINEFGQWRDHAKWWKSDVQNQMTTGVAPQAHHKQRASRPVSFARSIHRVWRNR